MRDWLYFYIEFTVKRGRVLKKEPGWALGLQKIENNTVRRQNKNNYKYGLTVRTHNAIMATSRRDGKIKSLDNLNIT